MKPEALTLSIIKLLKKSPTVRYFVVSIPGNKVYQKVFTFPKTVEGERLLEAMKLATTFQLPFAAETAYIDWEKISGEDRNDVFLAAAPRLVIGGFISALARAGVKTVAIETRGMSLGRVMEGDEHGVLVRETASMGTALYVIKNGIPYFSRILPFSYVQKESADKEIEKVKKFYGVEWKEALSRVADISELPLISSLSDELKRMSGTAAWAIALGAAIRGLLPRSMDTVVSVLPVGTEEAYEYQKAAAFSKFIAHAAVGLAIFWSAIFFGSWLLLLTIQENSNKELTALSALPASTLNLALEDRARGFNDLVAETHSILAVFPSWSIVIEELKAQITPGISVTALSLPAPDAVMSLSGVAATRADLNKFKKSLGGFGLISEVALPITNLEQKASIPFSVTFRMRDPQVLFRNQKTAP